MSTIMNTIDTHTVVKELLAAKDPEAQAEVLVKRFVIKEELDSVEKEHSMLATKADIMRLENATKANIARLESKIDNIEIKLESKIDNIASSLNSNIRDLTKDISWLKTISIANFTLLLGAVISALFTK